MHRGEFEAGQVVAGNEERGEIEVKAGLCSTAAGLDPGSRKPAAGMRGAIASRALAVASSKPAAPGGGNGRYFAAGGGQPV